MSSYRKINIAGIAFAFILIVLTTGFYTYRNLTRLRNEARAAANLDLRLANAMLNREMRSIEQTMTDIDEPALAFMKSGDRTELSRLMNGILSRHPYSLGFYAEFTPEKARELGFPEMFGYYREDDEILPFDLEKMPEEDYEMEWFRLPMTEKRNVWSDPYFCHNPYMDDIVSFSHPVLDYDGTPVGLLTEDVPSDWLARLIDVSERFSGAKYFLVTKDGKVVLSSDGIQEVPSSKDYFIYSGDVGSRGTQLILAVPSGDIYRKALADAAFAILMALVFVLFSAYVFWRISRINQARQQAETQRQLMAQEMNIAHEIQMGMVPDKFPPFPERKDLDIFAMMQPAQNIGGDFYDYFIRNEKLFFCIGDVSGKGVPASLLMSMCRTMFRTLAASENSPNALVSSINNGVKDIGGRDMFVTLFLGVLDLPTGILRYCNAGHNPPAILDGDDCTLLPVKPNLPAGVRKNYNYQREDCIMQPGQTLFLYTDGITEAMDPSGELFGTQRLVKTLSGIGTLIPRDVITAVDARVLAFAGGAAQNDDKTTLAIRYTPVEEEVVLSRSITMENKREELTRLHEFVAEFAADAGLPEKEKLVIDLCLEEAAINVILYAYPLGSKGFINLEAKLLPERMVFVLSDHGKPFDPTSLPDVDLKQRNKERQKGGLGVFLVRRNMDSINYECRDGQNILTLSRLLSHQDA